MKILNRIVKLFTDREEPQFIDRIRVTPKVFSEIKAYIIRNHRKDRPDTQQKIAWRFGVGRITVHLIDRSPSYSFYKENRRRTSKPDHYGRGAAV